MLITRGPVHKSRPLTQCPDRTRDYQSTMPTIASNTEKGSCELTEARLGSDRRIWKWVVRIDRPRAQGNRPPPDAGTVTRAFNAPAMFSPNPTVTGNVIGSEHPSNPPFAALSLQMSQSTAEHSETVVTSHHDPPRGIKSQRIDQQGHAWYQTLERIRSFPEKSRAAKNNTSTTLDVTTDMTYRRAHG